MATSSTSSAAHTSGPVPMEVGALDSADPVARQKGKSTGQKGNQNGEGGNKNGTKGDGKGKDKGRRKQDSSKPNAEREYCAICGPEKGKNHSTEDCFLNARSHPKGEGKGNKKGSAKANSVNAIDAADDETTVPAVLSTSQHNNDETTVPAVLSTSQQQIDALKQVTANQGQVGNPQPPSAQNKKTNQGSPSCSDILRIEHQLCSGRFSSEGRWENESATSHAVSAQQRGGNANNRAHYGWLWCHNKLCQQNVISTSRGGPNMTQPKPKNCGPSMETLSTTRAKFKQQPRSLQRDRVGKPRWCRPFSEWKWNIFRMEMEPVMAFCRILDDADCDLHFFRSSSGKVWKKSREYPMVRFRAW